MNRYVVYHYLYWYVNQSISLSSYLSVTQKKLELGISMFSACLPAILKIYEFKVCSRKVCVHCSVLEPLCSSSLTLYSVGVSGWISIMKSPTPLLSLYFNLTVIIQPSFEDIFFLPRISRNWLILSLSPSLLWSFFSLFRGIECDGGFFITYIFGGSLPILMNPQEYIFCSTTGVNWIQLNNLLLISVNALPFSECKVQTSPFTDRLSQDQDWQSTWIHPPNDCQSCNHGLSQHRLCILKFMAVR